MQSPSETLEQKQEYLRGAVDEDLYEDFFQFCTDVIGNVDINSWTMAEIHSVLLCLCRLCKGFTNTVRNKINREKRISIRIMIISPNLTISLVRYFICISELSRAQRRQL